MVAMVQEPGAGWDLAAWLTYAENAIVVGAGGALILSKVANFNTLISPLAILLACAFSAAVGISFGLWPARRAARMDPVAALRYE